MANHNNKVKVVTRQNALENLKLTSPDIQKDISNAIDIETVNVLIKILVMHYFLF